MSRRPLGIYRFFGKQLCFSGVLLLAAALSSCVAPGPGRTAKNTLWKVKGEQNTVYLLGSIHILPLTAYPLGKKLQAAFNDSQRVVFEVDLRTFTSTNLEHAFERTGFYPRGDTLSRHITPNTRRFLNLILPSFGTNLARVQKFRSWFLAELLSARYLQLIGYRDDLGVDFYFYRQAMAAKKPVIGLETIRQQAEIFTSFDDKRGEQYLVDTLVGLPAYSQRLSALVSAWRNGQIDQLDRLLNQHERNDPTSFSLLFARRNSKWLPTIEGFAHQPDNYLVVVGAGHLVGDQGVVEALRRVGYDVEQL
jgi:uncharacterized protein YbaP (TraB family)